MAMNLPRYALARCFLFFYCIFGRAETTLKCGFKDRKLLLSSAAQERKGTGETE